MANRWMQQFFYSFNHSPVYIQGSFVVGASGAVSGLTGSGINTVTKTAEDGTYLIDLQDNYYRFLGAQFSFSEALTGAGVTAGSFVTGTPYVITALGNTNWYTAGLSTELTPAVGMPFVAIAAGSGTGTVRAVAPSGVYTTEIIGNPQLTLKPNATPTSIGASLLVQCVDAAGTPVNPAEGSTCYFQLWYRNSSIKGKGE